MVWNENAFGKLIKTYRERRGWKQEELAERWGFSREYLSQVELGKRKLDKYEQVYRLADILGIPQDQLDAIGKGIPPRKLQEQSGKGGDDILLQALLEPAQNTVKMSWLLWQEPGIGIDVTRNLHHLQESLTAALSIYQGQFYVPALHMLAHTHEMLGKLAIERTATQEATAHFQEMYDIAEEVGNLDLQTSALIHQSEMFRRKGWYQTATRRMEAAKRNISHVSLHLQGTFWKAAARNSYVSGDKQEFLRAIDTAEILADSINVPTIDTLNSEFDKVEILQVRAQGHTFLWQPEKALEIYQETDKLRPFRPLRYQSSYHIEKAQAYCYAGDIETCRTHAIAGMQMAESLRSRRYVVRLQQMVDRASATALGKKQAVKELREEIYTTLQRMSDQ
ncbi:MAG: helix-turn-helix domain-containing protein [Ktedonobacteraceae bacterium]|nr:helix-turn-helix domain-containing protein [Ktedonobacteraceae bacterium]